MVDCPECGNEMRASGYIGPEVVYNCDNCHIDCYKPPAAKKTKRKKSTKLETKPEEKQEDESE